MRLFIGIMVPPDLRRHLQDRWNTLADRPASCHVGDPAFWHLTLVFLGEIGDSQLSALDVLISKAVEESPRGRFTFEEFMTFPAKHPAYIVARATPEPQAEWEKHVQTLRDLVSVAAPDIDRKPWVSHVTIARCKKAPRLPAWHQRIEPIAWEPKEITLVHSEPNPAGSRYTNLHVYPFKAT